MLSKERVQKSFRVAAVAAAALVLGNGAAQAATLSSGPLRLAELESFTCSAVNASGREVVANVKVTIANGGFGAEKNCSPLADKAVCTADNQAGFTAYRYCTITTSDKRGTRGSFCNASTKVCIPVQ
jgi:hypothetical protein